MIPVLTFGAFLFGAGICVLNFYLSFVRYPLFLRRGGKPELYRPVSGFPLVGSAVLIAMLLLVSLPPWLNGIAWAMLFMDTGGPLWLVIALLRRGQ